MVCCHLVLKNLDPNPLTSIPATHACPSGAHPYPSRRPNSLTGDLDRKEKVEVARHGEHAVQLSGAFLLRAAFPHAGSNIGIDTAASV